MRIPRGRRSRGLRRPARGSCTRGCPGSSRLGSTGDRLTRAGLSLGTPAYMSPAQAAADPEIDAHEESSSIVSAALRLYGLLSILAILLSGVFAYLAPIVFNIPEPLVTD